MTNLVVDDPLADKLAFPDVSLLITEDDTPVDNFASAKQQRLLVSSLYSSLAKSNFLAEANVGIYHTLSQPAIVPDVFVSYDVQVPEAWFEKQNRCYMVWNFGKPPEIVIEIVSNQVGNELSHKLNIYQQMRVSYYLVYDPAQYLGTLPLRLFELRGMRYTELTEPWLEQVNLGLTLWTGEFEGRQAQWLRWCDRDGNILLTGDEKAEQERARAEQEYLRAEQERARAEQEYLRAEQERARAEQEYLRAEQERARAERLSAILKAQGIDPEQLLS